MSYLDQSRRSPASIAAVVGVHAAVGYALLIGLGYTVIPHVPTRTTIFKVPNQPPPPPEHKPVEKQQSRQPVTPNPIPRPDPRPQTEEPLFKPIVPDGSILAGGGGGGTTVLPPIDPPRPSQAADAVPGKDRLRWISTDDYPPGALRQNMQGVVVISVMIGADGKVRSCLVTQSSGSKLLDDATCRLYTARARFTPARDADGNPTTAQRTDRYRWQIPNE